jgi:hypothetical protein
MLISLPTFDKDVQFNLSEFKKAAEFQQMILNGDITFWITTFKGFVTFYSAQINRRVRFSNCKFYRPLSFSSVKLSDSAKLIFDGSLLPDTIDFSHISNLHTEVDLLSCDLSDSTRMIKQTGVYKPHYINLYKSDISKFHLDYTHFRIILSDKRIDKNVFPNGDDLSDDEAKTVYEALLKNFRDRGQMDSYELLDKEYQRFKGKNSFLRWRSWLPDLWWGFGYNKERIFLYTAIFLMVFTFFTFLCLDKLNNEDWGVYNIEMIPELPVLNRGNITFHEGCRRLWYSCMYTSTIFFLLTLKVDKIRFKRVLSLYVLLVYFVGILCLGYMANFIFAEIKNSLFAT